jgi:hypothetical protein
MIIGLVSSTNFIGKKDVKSKLIASFDFLIEMNQKKISEDAVFLIFYLKFLTDNLKILSVIQSHKQDLRDHFSSLLEDPDLSDHIYLLFESSIVESQVFRSNELIEKSKKIVNNLIH